MVTIVSGRREHLVNQHRALSTSVTPPHCYIVVAMNEPTAHEWLPRVPPYAATVAVTTPDKRLPLAAARNLGAQRAIEESAEVLVFLDVDCVPTAELITAYATAAGRHPDALLGGAVGYLPEGVGAFDANRMSVARFHEFRPRLADGDIAPADPNLFWSLSFATTAETWKTSGGFHEMYRGYGGEDTDFALSAQRANVPFLWVGGAEALHQYHSTESPPVRHLDDILDNGRLFARRWGYWPMSGWLEAFHALGLVARDARTGGWAKVGASVGPDAAPQEGADQ